MTPKLENPWENPWNVQSLKELRYYNCPSCPFLHASKQDFICHAYDSHPESVNYLKKITDGSLEGILCPWDSNDYKIELGPDDKLTDYLP